MSKLLRLVPPGSDGFFPTYYQSDGVLTILPLTRSADQSNGLHSLYRNRKFCEVFLHALWLVCMYLCMYVCMYVYVCVYVWMYVCVYVCMHACMDGWMNGWMDGWIIYIYICVCMYVCTYVRTYVCMYVW